MIFQTEKQLNELGDKLASDKKAAVEKALERLKEVHKQQLVEDIDPAIKAVTDALQAAAQDIYAAQNAAGAQPGAGQQPNPGAGAQPNNGPEDVEFEEVK